MAKRFGDYTVLIMPSASAYFWTQDPLDFGHTTAPPSPPDPLDGAGTAYVYSDHSGVSALLFGSTNEGSPSIISKDVSEYNGWTLMWVVQYTLGAVPYSGETARAWVELDLDWKDDGEGAWADGDYDSACIIVYTWSNPPIKNESGWLYVWIDCAYDQDDEFRLTFTAHSQYLQQTTWVDLVSPSTARVYFQIDEI